MIFIIKAWRFRIKRCNFFVKVNFGCYWVLRFMWTMVIRALEYKSWKHMIWFDWDIEIYLAWASISCQLTDVNSFGDNHLLQHHHSWHMSNLFPARTYHSVNWLQGVGEGSENSEKPLILVIFSFGVKEVDISSECEYQLGHRQCR